MICHFFKIYSMFFTSSTELNSFSRSRDYFVWPFPSVYLDSLSNKLLLDNLDVHIMGANTLLIMCIIFNWSQVTQECHLDWHSSSGPCTLTSHSAGHHVPELKEWMELIRDDINVWIERQLWALFDLKLLISLTSWPRGWFCPRPRTSHPQADSSL